MRLKTVRVVDTSKTAGLSAQVGTLLTGAELPERAVLAIGWGRAVQSVISTGLPALPGAIVVPTTGGMHETASHFQINEFVRKAAEQTGGEARFLYAPSNPSRELRAVLLRDPDTTRIMDFWSRVDAAILGIGSVQTSTATPGSEFPGAGSEAEIGDVARHYFDISGYPIERPDHVDPMTITREQLRRIPLSIGVATGPSKAAAIIGAARSGMIGALVTNLQTAWAVLNALEDPG
jgi:DNA-binding transcriptional regulator LsrR (DeoR family)